MKNIPQTPIKLDPVLFDKLISEVQLKLVTRLDWLDYAFGFAQTLVKNSGSKPIRYPAVYIRSDRYEDVGPDQVLGNYCFATLSNQTGVETGSNFNTSSVLLKGKISIIFFVNLQDIYNNKDHNIEQLKLDVISAFKQLNLTSGRLTLNTLEEGAKNVFGDYDMSELDTQYLMQPYYALKLTFNAIVESPCLE